MFLALCSAPTEGKPGFLLVGTWAWRHKSHQHIATWGESTGPELLDYSFKPLTDVRALKTTRYSHVLEEGQEAETFSAGVGYELEQPPDNSGAPLAFFGILTFVHVFI